MKSGDNLTGLSVSPLKEGEIQLWGISLNTDEALFEKCKAALSDSERERISFYNFKQVQNNYVISQGGLRLLLSNYLNVLPKKIQMKRHDKGKPFVEEDTTLCFNISNSGSYCVYAFSRAGEVGIDLEELRTLPDIDQLIDKNFTEKERRYINADSKLKSKRFFQFWTIKEAYLKAIGEGMRLTPDSLEFTTENGNYKLEAVKGIFEQEDWLFKEITPHENYVGTLTFKGINTTVLNMRFI